jgi:uncharacterized lipoprotein YbaY
MLLAFLLVSIGTATASAQVAWLDRPIGTNWNRGTGVVPTAPRMTASSPESQMCRTTIRTPESVTDRALTRAGWFLFGPVQTYGSTSVVTAMASVDGMCRPNQYNAFVFLGPRFVGTISPDNSDARSDASLRMVRLENATELNAEFNRYTSTDALCCPSQLSTVTYTIDGTGARAVVKAEDVDTQAVCDNDGPIRTQDNVISGTVTYRQRVALPQSAVLTVVLLDVSRADASGGVIAEQRFETAGRQVPISFDMTFEPGRIQERNRYAVRAEIRDGDRLLFTTDTNYPVITQGNPRTVEMNLVPVGGAGRPGRGESVIRGTVTYRQRIAMPPNAEVNVRLVDSADPDASPVAETTITPTTRQVPIPFELNFDLSDINRQRTYELRAEIRSEGQVRFRNQIGQVIDPRANPNATVELVVEPASDEPQTITGRTLSVSKIGPGTMQIAGRGSMILIRGAVNVRSTGDADITLTRFDGSITFSGKLTYIDDTTARISVTNSGDADASGEIQIVYSGRSLRTVTATDLVLDSQNVTLRY